MNSFESYFDVDHREQAKRKQQNCLLTCRIRQTRQPRQTCQTGQPRQTGQTLFCKIGSFAVGMVLGWMAGTITYCVIHIITQ